MNDFITLFTLAKAGDTVAVETILNMYRPLLYKESMLQGIFDEDLFQELCLVLLNCLAKFTIQ